MRKKADVINDIADRCDLPKAVIEKVLDAQAESITETLNKEGDYQMLNIGIFTVFDRPAREGRNPSTGETLQIPASKAVKFKVSTALKNQVQ